MLLRYFISTTFLIYFTTAQSFHVYINTSAPVHTVSDRFLSVVGDIGELMSSTWFGLNFTMAEPLASALGPAYFRFGGTDADRTYFRENLTKSTEKSTFFNATDYVATGYQIDQLYNFTKIVGWRLIFDLNLMLRNGSNWDPNNAEKFLNYTSSKGYEMDFELGNEPDFYPGGFNKSLTGAQIAKDYKSFRNLLNSYNLYKNSIIIGPSVGCAFCGPPRDGTQIVLDFLKNGGGDYIGGLSNHYYYMNGATASLNDFLNHTTFDTILKLFDVSKSFNFGSKWLGETGSCWGGGKINLSDTYVGGFIWMDELGISALNEIDVVARMQLHSTDIGLLDRSNYPQHDYWLSLVYKRLVGTKVFSLKKSLDDPNLRIYAASSKNIKNGLVIYGMRLTNESFTIDFPDLSPNKATVFLFRESELGNLLSLASTLNGQLLEWGSHQPGPNYQGKVTTLPIELPGYSQFFIVIDPNTDTQCPDGWTKENTNTNKCIKFVSSTPSPLFGAKFDCATYGNNASILTIDNAFENAEIYQAAKKFNCNQLYIGLYRSDKGWTWSNSDPLSYRNWKSGELVIENENLNLGYPTNDTTKNCVVFEESSGAWFNVDCNSAQCYICQKYI